MNKFEVGKWYSPEDDGFEAIQIQKRTDHFIFVKNETGCEWRMKIKNDGKQEFVTDSSVPKRWRQAFTYCVEYEVPDYERR